MKLSQRPLHFFHLLLLCHEVAANTEIINFSSPRERTVDLPLDVVGNWSTLHSSDNERQWALEPAALHTHLHQVCERDEKSAPFHPPFSCPHELWLLLDLDDEKWSSYATFTLRLSWSASTPAEFTIAVYSPQDLLARLSEPDLISTAWSGRGNTHGRSFPHTSSSTPHAPTTRSRYARIRAVHAGVPTPGIPPRSSPLSIPPHPRIPVPVPHPDSDVRVHSELSVDGEEKGTRVSFVVILEPLYLGVLPVTLLSTVGVLITTVLAAIALVPWIIAYFEPFVRQAREDLNAGMTRTSKER